MEFHVINNNQAVRYHADNIAVLSFNEKGELEWNNVMGKSQYDDESDDHAFLPGDEYRRAGSFSFQPAGKKK